MQTADVFPPPISIWCFLFNKKWKKGRKKGKATRRAMSSRLPEQQQQQEQIQIDAAVPPAAVDVDGNGDGL